MQLPAKVLEFSDTRIPGTSVWYCEFPSEEQAQTAWAKQHQALLPETLSQSHCSRKTEFIAGRLAAQAALAQTGFSDFQVASNSDRSPAWPEGIKGSISHKNNIAVAAVSNTADFVGIDLESPMTEQTANKLSRKIINETEKQLLRDSTIAFEQGFTRVFSAKEALYKAIYPDIRRYLSFSVCQLTTLKQDSLILKLQSELCHELQHPRPFEIHYHLLRGQCLSVLVANRQEPKSGSFLPLIAASC